MRDITAFSLGDAIRQKELIGFRQRTEAASTVALAKSAFVGEALDLQVAISNSNPTPEIGDIITITVDVANVSQFNITATNVIIQDVLPQGLTFVSTSSGTGTYDPTTGNWSSIVGIPAGVTQSFTIEARVTDPGTLVDTATLTNSTPDDFNNTSNNSASTSVMVKCFLTGTNIRISRNGSVADVPVEDLRVGDVALTAGGGHRQIRWIGCRTIDCREQPRPHEAHPVRVAAGAFGPNLPVRDLFLSPGHPVLVGADEDGCGGHLVPVMCLINGTTIERVAGDEVTYWHIELDEHDILLAEGLPAESYIDLGSRPWFAGAPSALYDPDLALPGMPGRCRPIAIDGPVVEAERRRLDMVFAMRLGSAAAWPTAEDALAL